MSKPEPTPSAALADTSPVEMTLDGDTVKAEVGPGDEDGVAATPATANANRLSKEENKTISGILERLTAYKDDEYALCLPLVNCH